MKVITYRIRLTEPALLTALLGDPNSAVSYNFLPGSALRGAVIGKYLTANNQVGLDATDPDVRRLFFGGTTRYLNGYPVDQQNNRTLPTPLSWQRVKGEEWPVYDLAIEEPEEKAQWQSVGKPFCYFDGEDDRVSLVQPERRVTIHTARDRRYGRPREESGAVYRYDALAAEQVFEAAIVCDEDRDVETLLPLLQGNASLGGSRTAGYGATVLSDATAIDQWREVGQPFSSPGGGQLVVTFFSDALIRDSSGQLTVDPRVVTGALSARLGVPLVMRKAFLRGRHVGGFNRRWGLPLVQALAVQAGSVLVYDSLSCTPEALRQLESRGLGERTAEGFGRIGLDWHLEPKWNEKSQGNRQQEKPRAIPEKSPAAELAGYMVQRMLRQKLDSNLARRVNDLGRGIRVPTNSQLNRLRTIAQNALRQPREQGRALIKGFLNSIEDRPSVLKQFQRDRVAGNKDLFEWLGFRVSDEKDIWNELGVASNELPSVGTVTAKLTPELAYEYNLRLIHGVVARAVKENRKEYE